MVTQDDILYELDRIKKRQKIAPGDWREKMPSAIPNLPQRQDMSFLKDRLDSIGGTSQAATKEALIMQQNKRDYQAMVDAEKQLKKAKKKLKNTDRPVIKVPVGQPNYISNPVAVPTRPNQQGGGKGGKPNRGPAIDTSGPGWQDRTPLRGVSTGNVTTVNWRGHTLQLNPSAVDNFIGFLNALAATGYNIQTIGSHAVRNIAGTNTPSLHSYGIAIDINPSQNPVTYGAPVTNLPKGVGRLAAKYGLAWGGTWNGSKKDTMHFSIPYGGTK